MYRPDNFARRIRSHQLIADQVARHPAPPVAARPFANVARRTVTAQVHRRQQVGIAPLFDQVGERHVIGIVVLIVPPFDNRKDPGAGRQQNIGIAAELATAQVDALMDRTGLIHVVALVRAAACIEKREIPGDQQRGPVMRNRVRPGKHGTGLAVRTMAVSEEKRMLGRKSVFDHHAFPHKTTPQHRPGINPGRTGDDEIACRHPRTYAGRGFRRTVDGSVAQRGSTIHSRVSADAHIDQRNGVHHRSRLSDISP